ncbi:Dihydroceramide delta(4)-desaturase, partial [Tolypocladium paradoxum]
MPPTASATVTKGDVSPPSDDANPKHDFFWTYTEEPHRTRRLAIIKAHPE